MNDAEFETLLGQMRRGGLSPGERAGLEARLASDPRRREIWLEEAALNRLLEALPPADLGPGFTRQVLTAVESEATAVAPVRRGWLRLPSWRLATAIAGCLALFLAVHARHRAVERTHLAESVATLAPLAELPSLEALGEFDLVYNLPEGPLPDLEELARALE